MICLAINFFGLLAFYFPCLAIHLLWNKKQHWTSYFKFTEKSEQTCSYPSRKEQEEILDNVFKEDLKFQSDVNTDFIKQTISSNSSNLSIDVIKNKDNTNTKEKNNQREISLTQIKYSKQMVKILYNIFCFNSNILLETNFKYLLIVMFILFFFFNILVCVFYSKVDLPLNKLIPQESYLKHHMENHFKYFNLGPVLILNFIKPLYYKNNQTYFKIRSLLNDFKSLNGISKFEINWLEEAIKKSKTNAQYYPECQDNIYEIDCFHRSIREVLSEPQNWNDVNFFMNNYSNQSKELFINSHRIYLQIENFSGTVQDLKLMNSLKYLADKKYDFKRDDLIIFSVVFKYLEEMNEIIPSIFSFFLLTFECLFFIGLLLSFDLNSIFILVLIYVSTVFSIFSFTFIFDVTLNIVTLFQYIMVPSLVFEFFFHTPYLFLYKSVEITNLNNLKNPYFTSKNGMHIPDTSSRVSFVKAGKYRIKYIKFVFNSFTKTSCSYLFYNLIFSFIFMCSCSTYSFHTFFIMLISTCFSIFIHLTFFYPVILFQFGTQWKK